MKLNSKEMDEEVEIDMSPMIDMVFLLLIFFIVASKIISDKPPVEVPFAKAVAIAKEDQADDSVRFMISISKDKDAENHYYIPSSADTPVSFDELEPAIQEAVDDANRRHKDFFVLIRGDSKVEFKDTEKVMRACAGAGAYNLIFAAKEES